MDSQGVAANPSEIGYPSEIEFWSCSAARTCRLALRIRITRVFGWRVRCFVLEYRLGAQTALNKQQKKAFITQSEPPPKNAIRSYATVSDDSLLHLLAHFFQPKFICK